MRISSIFIFFLTLCTATVSYGATVPAASLTDKIDQMIMLGFRGTSVADGSDIAEIVKTTNIGGVILFDYDSPTKTYGRNIVSSAQVRALTAALQAHAKTPLLIAVDEEGGQVSRLKHIPGFTVLPSAQSMGTFPHSVLLQEQNQLATTLSDLGINTNFAPVLDLTSSNPAAPLTKQRRTFSSNPETVAMTARSIVEAMNTQHIVSAGKHFPGLGNATIDTHKGLATTLTHDAKALIPYALLKDTLPMVMVGHLIDAAVDPILPASLSALHMSVLRNTIGYNGVIITDDLDMGAITDHYTTPKAAAMAIAAGADMVIISNNIRSYNPQVFYETQRAVLEAVYSGAISPEHINDAYERIMHMKHIYAITP